MEQRDSHTQTATISQIEERLRQLSPDKLAVVFDFVAFLVERQSVSESLLTMLASEPVLRRDWDRPEEDALLGSDLASGIEQQTTVLDDGRRIRRLGGILNRKALNATDHEDPIAETLDELRSERAAKSESEMREFFPQDVEL